MEVKIAMKLSGEIARNVHNYAVKHECTETQVMAGLAVLTPRIESLETVAKDMGLTTSELIDRVVAQLRKDPFSVGEEAEQETAGTDNSETGQE